MPLHRPRLLRRPSWALSALALAAASLPAHAVEYLWAGGGGLWNDPAKWSLLGVPGADDSATINFTGTSYALLTEATRVGRLQLGGGVLGGAQTLEIGEFVFNGGSLGTDAAPGGTATVLGSTLINGATQLGVGGSQALRLLGNTTWSTGNGIVGVAPAYSNSGGSFPTSQLLIGSATTFSDLGAASAGGSKSLGHYGGVVRNEGLYVRSGLGSTLVTGFDNRGVIDIQSGTFIFSSSLSGSSSGQINVASGSTLQLGTVALTAGAVNNLGRVVLGSGAVQVAAQAQIGGAWQVDANNQVATLAGTQALQSLAMNAGRLSAAGELTLGTLAFNGGILGHIQSLAPGQVTVTGAATINGAAVLAVEYAQSLTLQGSSTWSAGNGRLSTGGAYMQGSQPVVESVLRIGSGSVFTDLGAGDANGVKVLGGGGRVVNDGSYLRQGTGFTLANRFVNNGLVQLASGVFAVDAQWSNLGRVDVAAGALLAANEGNFVNAGTLSGTGIVRPFGHANLYALVNRGTLDPGSVEAAGTLAIDGGLTMADGAVLHIDLFGDTADQLVVADGVTWHGELALAGEPAARGDGQALSFVIASYGQRLGNASFERITWNGVETTAFTVVYGENQLTLHVSAVPEPAPWALLLGGFGALCWRRQRAQ